MIPNKAPLNPAMGLSTKRPGWVGMYELTAKCSQVLTSKKSSKIPVMSSDMGGNQLGNQIGTGIMQQRMQQNPMPPGQQGPPNPLFSMLPEMKYSPDKGLSVTLSPDHLNQLISGIGLVKQPPQQGMMPQMGQQQQGMPPILPPQGA
jgi:hypothetical protein